MTSRSPSPRGRTRSVDSRRDFSATPPRYQRDSRSPSSHRGSRDRHRPRSRSHSRSRSRSRDLDRYSRNGRDRSESPIRSTKIVVEKLSKNINESHLREIFGQFGQIRDMDLPMNRNTNTNRGTAYILYTSDEHAEDAIAHMHEAIIDGAIVNVSIVLPRRKLSPDPPLARRGANFDPRQPPPGRGPANGAGAPPGAPTGPAGRRRASPGGRYGPRSDVYRPRSVSRSPSRSPSRGNRYRNRSPTRSYSSRSPSRSVTPPRRRNGGGGGGGRRPSYHSDRRSPSYDSRRSLSRSRTRSPSRSRQGDSRRR